MDGIRKRRLTIAAICIGIVAAAWWAFAVTYTRTATIAITATYPTDEADDPDADIPAYRGVGLDLSGYDPLPQVSDRLAEQRGGSAADYSDTVSITPIDDGTAHLAVTAKAGDDSEAVELANQAAAIVVDLFNSVPTGSADVVFRADVAEPAR
ncbi:hypothetical protein [Rhodococcus sp. NPDC076796]|uniref:hypothetical protein n=1 Tax=Rhodococcus sp. NPDC076796 TaxID=3154859 RepID=UPI002ADBA9E8|nr:hypothetical protein [Rhodococcus sp. (in: high G+C Gram-positive bacteria)]